ncbi:hypothetical protein TREES_T100000732 [Tupaia chinensis]|uniref:Uncharacterized protein n=1 Tax=Tupaia chinensis TaxID=246437 RepID=L9KJ50_TUPCH|nr:hypothetical protein TREES_T100000732 [Tupaia chinensis]
MFCERWVFSGHGSQNTLGIFRASALLPSSLLGSTRSVFRAVQAAQRYFLRFGDGQPSPALFMLLFTSPAETSQAQRGEGPGHGYTAGSVRAKLGTEQQMCSSRGSLHGNPASRLLEPPLKKAGLHYALGSRSAAPLLRTEAAWELPETDSGAAPLVMLGTRTAGDPEDSPSPCSPR